ncbi:MAG: outer membrane beta-barrel protein [Bacteroidota bacterium]
MNKLLIIFFLTLSQIVKSQEYNISCGLSFTNNSIYPMDGFVYSFRSLNPKISFGYSFNKKLSIEVLADKLVYSSNLNEGFSFSDFNVKMIRLMPSLKYNFYLKSVTVYGYIGGSLGLDFNMRSNFSSFNDVPPYDSTILKSIYSKTLVPGYDFGIGIEYKFNGRMSIFGKIESIYNYVSKYDVTITENIGYTYINYSPMNIHSSCLTVGLNYYFR